MKPSDTRESRRPALRIAMGALVTPFLGWTVAAAARQPPPHARYPLVIGQTVGETGPAPGGRFTARDYARVAKPANTAEILRNIKLVYDHNLLLDLAFYTSANLRTFFGGTDVEIDTLDRTGRKLDARISRFTGISKAPDFNANVENIGMFMFREPVANGRTSARLNLTLYGNNDVDASLLFAVFGDRWGPPPPVAPLHGQSNLRSIEMRNDSRSVQKRAFAELVPSGQLYILQIEMTGK